MSRLGSRLSAAVLAGVMLTGWCGSAAAVDPIVLFLLRMLRDKVATSIIEAGVNAAQKPGPQEPPLAALPPRLTPPPPEGQWLRSLIEESFVHLSQGQREELHASLMRILNDARHLEARGMILAEFTRQAIAMRDAHRQLAGLSPDQMKAIAVEARREYERLPADQRSLILQGLQQGIPGVPRTLNELMIAEFSSAAAAAR